jgi:acetyl-CoA acyltransferase 2
MSQGSQVNPVVWLTAQVANLKLSDMDLVEINEAFAAQYLACAKELGLDDAKSNSNGKGCGCGGARCRSPSS